MSVVPPELGRLVGEGEGERVEVRGGLLAVVEMPVFSGCVVVEGEGGAMVALPAHLLTSTACTEHRWSGIIMYTSSPTRVSDWLGAVKLPFTTI